MRESATALILIDVGSNIIRYIIHLVWLPALVGQISIKLAQRNKKSLIVMAIVVAVMVQNSG